MKKILIWGTGQIARAFVSKLDSTDVIFGFIQTNPVENTFGDWHIYSPNDLPEGDFYIIVANSFSDEIHRLCEENGIDDKKVVYLLRGFNTLFNDADDIEEIIGTENYTKYLFEYGRIEKSFFYKDLEKYNLLKPRKNFYADKDNLWPIIQDKYEVNSGQGNYFGRIYGLRLRL